MITNIPFHKYAYIIIGTGFYGAVMAERIANDLGQKVLIIEKRNHIGGNCYSTKDEETGILYHVYGTHIFHTSDEQVWKYINKFTEFNGYRHQVLVTFKNKVYQMPINLETINSFYNISLKPFEVDDFLKQEIEKENISNPTNFEEKAISMIGRPLYEAFLKGYTKKQWQKNPTDLPISILTRLPFRKNYDESYFFSRWQGVPLNGYTAIFENLLKHENIDTISGINYFEIRNQIPKSCKIIYTGPIDQFFDYEFGKLEWKTLQFKKKILNYQDYQGTSVMNYTEESIPYTRIHEPRHLHPEHNYPSDKTLIIKEYSLPNNDDNSYYPINDKKNNYILKQYLQKATLLKDIIIGGRLGEYKYYDMGDVISQALKTYNSKIRTKFN